MKKLEKKHKKIKENEEIRKKALEDIKKNNKNIIDEPPKKNNINNKNNDNKKKDGKNNKKSNDEDNDKKGKKTKARFTIRKLEEEENETQNTIKYKVQSKESNSSLRKGDDIKEKKKSKFSLNNFINKEKGKLRSTVNDDENRRASVTIIGRRSSVNSKLGLKYKKNPKEIV